MEKSRKQVLPSFLGKAKPTMIKVGKSYKCSLCKKTGDYSALVPHIQTHSRNVVSYKGVLIYRCGLNCKDASDSRTHHHCCFCNKGIVQKQWLVRHMQKCEEHLLPMSPRDTCSKAQIVVQTIPGTSLLQTVTATAHMKLQGTATPLVLQAVPCLSLQTTSTPALPSQRPADKPSPKQTSTDTASSAAKPSATETSTDSSSSATSTDASSAKQTSADKPPSEEQSADKVGETDKSSSSPRQQSPPGSQEPPVSSSPPSSPSPVHSPAAAASGQQPATATDPSSQQQPPTPAEPQEQMVCEETVLSLSDPLHLSIALSPPPIDLLPPLSPTECSSPSTSTAAPPKENSRQRVKCPYCSTHLIRRNLKVHINRQHKDILADAKVHSEYRSLYVDAKNGILAVQRHTHGFLSPVHVQRWDHHGGSGSGSGDGQEDGVDRPGPRCDLKACQQFQQMSERHGLTVSHCQHTRHADLCAITAAEEHLHAKTLDEMVAAKILTEAKRAMCLRRQKMAKLAKVPFSVHVDLDGSPKRLFLSIHEPRTKEFSCLGRVMVSYDTDGNVWLCPCTKGPMSCLHKSIAKWHVFQTHRDLFRVPVPPACSRDTMEFPTGSNSSTYSLNSDVKRSVDYIFDQKRIPVDLPQELTSTVLEFPGQLFPLETVCGLCPSSPVLEEAENVTYQAKIVTMMGVADYVSTFIRRCPACHMVYRYQEWRDGLHNFNNHLLLSIELCLYFRHSLQNNIPMAKAVKTLESLRKVTYPPTETLLTAYSHFEAMMSSEHADQDVSGSPSAVMDLHKKAFLVLHWS